MLWFSAARRGLRCNPDRQTLPANDARKGTPRMRFRSQSDPGTRLTTLETGSPTQTWPHPAHLEGDDFTAYVLVLYTTFRWTGRSCTGHLMGSTVETTSGTSFCRLCLRSNKNAWSAPDGRWLRINLTLPFLNISR